MYLDSFYQRQQQQLHITPEQGSRFAKEIAGDFNPLHDAHSKRFCVPGDLLFSLLLSTQGLAQQMQVKYTGMVGKETPLFLPHSSAEIFELLDANQKSYLQVKRRGTISHDAQLIERFARAYVAFSGLSFPDLLVPLMEKHSVMINPERPMVVYDSMEFDLAHTTLVEPQLELSHHQLEVNGKRGLVTLEFTISDQNQPIGKGCKRMTLGGLRDYNPQQMQQLVDLYQQSKKNYAKVA